ncbi:MAG: hypothetical protein A4E57_01994 [Syntrophorhabdaceae bacterium PtaU1.Bin034]|nr:MAG: hypothetical protein A4E57_01994 [Syntrophorhabdaceae bacterium PtaU1.Bin034]
MTKISRLMLTSVVLAFLLLMGCGGSDTTSPPETSGTTATISGVAAAGAPLSGTVFLKDSSNPVKEVSQGIAADGSFSFDIANLTAPFLLKAVGTSGGQNFTLFSFKSASGTGNINPLSNLAVSQALGGADPSTLYDAPNPATMQAILTALPNVITDIQTKLAQLLSLGGASNADFISGPFTANHQGLDLVFDLVSISVNAGTVTIINKASNGVIFTSPLSNKTLEGQIDANNLPVIPPPGSSFAVSGKVTDAAGAGISGVTITFNGSPATTTDASGNYRISGVQNGSYTLTASLSGSVFHPSSLTAVVGNADVTGRNFISYVETTAALPGDQFFTFITGVIPGGVPSEIMYNDTDGVLILPHASAQKVDQAYDTIIQAPYGIYRDSNGEEPPIFPATAGTVYVMRSTMGDNGPIDGARYFKLQIDDATLISGDTRGTVTFRYAPILPLDIVDAVGEWEFPNGAHLSVLSNTVWLDYTAQPGDPTCTIEGSYTSSSIIAGEFMIFNQDGTNTTGAVTVTLALTADGKLNATLVGDAPLGSVTLTGGVRQQP